MITKEKKKNLKNLNYIRKTFLFMEVQLLKSFLSLFILCLKINEHV